MTVTERLPLSRERIVVEALALIDRDGLDRLSMRRLGSCLGVEAMSLYNHVNNKDDLLDGVVDLMLSRVEVPTPDVGGWRDRLRALALNFRALGLDHPEAFVLLVDRPKRSLRSWEPLLESYRIFRSLGLSEQAAADAYHAAAGFVVGSVLSEIAFLRRSADGTRGIGVEDVPPELAELREFVAADRCGRDEERFRIGVDLFIAGIETTLPST